MRRVLSAEEEEKIKDQVELHIFQLNLNKQAEKAHKEFLKALRYQKKHYKNNK